jgi:hypothetical protein
MEKSDAVFEERVYTGGRNMQNFVEKVFVVLIFCGSFFVTTIYAQDMNKDDKIGVTRSIIQTERESIK